MNKETHPFLEIGNIPGSTRLILGSFPVYSITIPDNVEKQKIRKSDGSIQFFYGSCKSGFWSLYHLYIDSGLHIPITPEGAVTSLFKNQIAISDMIIECEREGTSALDSDLLNRVYNIKMMHDYLNSGVTKILCTSKGVLEMFHNQVVKKTNSIIYQESDSRKWQSQIISELKGNETQIKNHICKQYLFKGKTIRLLSIPSPGSPQRQLKQFGYAGSNWSEYANKYFEFAFQWLKID